MNLCFTWNNDHFKTKIVSHETFQNLTNKFVSCETVNKSFFNKLLIVIKFNNYRFLISCYSRVLYLCKLVEIIPQWVTAMEENKVTPFWGVPLTFRLRPTTALFLQTLSENRTYQSLCINKNLQPPKTFFHQLQV